MPMAADAYGGEDEDAMFSAEEDFGDEEECRICRLPAEPARPLRHPCACRGSIRFVHDDCQLQWIATRHQRRCEVCKREISIRLLYAADTPSRLPVYELMAGLPDKLTGLLLGLVFVVFVVPEFVVHLTNLWAWRLAFARSFGQVHYLLALRLSAASVLALFAVLVGVEHWVEIFDVAPFARWVACLETRFEGFEGLQVIALYAVEVFMMVIICDMGLACILGFLPFSLGRITLWCISLADFCNGDEVNSYTSTVYVLLIGYGFIISAGITFAVLNTFGQYLRGERLTIATFFKRGIAVLIDIFNFCLKFLGVTIYPLLLGWSLDIWASKMVGATMSQRFKLLFASPFSSTALHWLVGHTFLYLHTRLFILHHKILRPGVAIPPSYNIDEPFYKLYFKKPVLFGITFVPAVIFVSIKIADLLAPQLFPLDLTYFNHPAKGLSFWQAPRIYADSLCCALIPRFIMDETDILIYVEWLAKKVTRHSFSTSVVLMWLALIMFNSAVLIFPTSIGRALLFGITGLPLACGLKSSDLLVFLVGFGIISAIIAASRDSFVYMTCGRAHLVALNRCLASFLSVIIIPFLMGSLADLLLRPLLPAGPDDDAPVFYIWCMGNELLRIWLNLVHQTRATPFLAYFIDERWRPKLVRYSVDYHSGALSLCWFFQDMFMPMATKLLVAMGIPYVFAKDIFPRFGHSDAVNSVAYRFAWLGILGFYALCHLSKVFCVELHASIRDDRYVIGKKVEDAVGKPDISGSINS